MKHQAILTYMRDISMLLDSASDHPDKYEPIAFVPYHSDEIIIIFASSKNTSGDNGAFFDQKKR